MSFSGALTPIFMGFRIGESSASLLSVPFGVRAHLPFGRLEISGAAGGARVQYVSTVFEQLTETGSLWAPQAGVGAKVRLDGEGRFSAGASLRYYRDVREWDAPRVQRLNVMGTLTHSFGRR